MSQLNRLASYPLVSGRVLLDEVADPRDERLSPLGVGDGLGNLAGTDGTPVETWHTQQEQDNESQRGGGGNTVKTCWEKGGERGNCRYHIRC